MSLADTFFDNSLRVETILWLAALCDSPSDAFERFVECSNNKSTTKLISGLPGITAKRWHQLAGDEDHVTAVGRVWIERTKGARS